MSEPVQPSAAPALDVEKIKERIAAFCEQTARDGILPSLAWFTETAKALREAIDVSGFKDILPPLQRYGVDHVKLCLKETFIVPMADGYWTPWHIAHTELESLLAEVARLRAQPVTDRAEILELLEDIYGCHRSQEEHDSDWQYAGRDSSGPIGPMTDVPCAWCERAKPIIARLRALQETKT